MANRGGTNPDFMKQLQQMQGKHRGGAAEARGDGNRGVLRRWRGHGEDERPPVAAGDHDQAARWSTRMTWRCCRT